MNTILSICVFASFVLCSFAVLELPKGDGPYALNLDMAFLNGLKMTAVEEFINIQLDRNFTKGERDSKMNAWAKKQGKDVQKQFEDFMKKMKKGDRAHIQKFSSTIFKEYTKQLHAIFNNPKLSHSGVCKQLNTLAEKMAVKMRTIGEKGPRSHTPCSVDDKQ